MEDSDEARVWVWLIVVGVKKYEQRDQPELACCHIFFTACLFPQLNSFWLRSRRFADNIFAFLSISSTTFQQRPFGNCWFIDSAHQWSTFVFRVRGWYIPSSLPHIFLFWSFLLFQKVSQSELWRQWRRSQETIVKPGGRVPVPPQGVAFL